MSCMNRTWIAAGAGRRDQSAVSKPMVRHRSTRLWAVALAVNMSVMAGFADCAWAQDCNGNGVADEEDIANGTSEDCNANGVPDECDFGPEHILHDNFLWANDVYAADIDGDGDMDVLGTAHDSDRITWWENETGDGALWIEHDVVLNYDKPSTVRAADIDGDGDMDVLGASSGADDINWWKNAAGDGTVWIEHTVDSFFPNPESVDAADVDGDGDIDVLGAATGSNSITWWENSAGNGTVWIQRTVDDDFSSAISVYAADVDGDGDMDVLGAACGADDITWWDNTAGDGTVWIEHTIDNQFENARSVYAEDVDGDGDMDVLGAAFGDDDITWWENTAGDGTVWIEHTVDGDFDSANCVYAADVDGDGDMDVLGAASGASDITWWENTVGDGTAWVEHTVDDDFDFARSVFAADLDGDEDIDILGASLFDNEITWWENQLNCFDCPADIDCNCTVGTSDLIVLLGSWGPCKGCPADFDDDGVVGTSDLIELLGNWGPCPP